MEKRMVQQIWERTFPDLKAVQSWIVRVQHSPPLSDIPKFLHWNASSVHQQVESLVRHLEEPRTVGRIIMSLAAFHAPSFSDSDSDEDNEENNAENQLEDNKEIQAIKCYLGLSSVLANLNAMYINVLKERLPQDGILESTAAWRKLMKTITDRIYEYNELKLSERYLAEEFLL
ncbi:uncharacterized protein [Anabrus simplex]